MNPSQGWRASAAAEFTQGFLTCYILHGLRIDMMSTFYIVLCVNRIAL